MIDIGESGTPPPPYKLKIVHIDNGIRLIAIPGMQGSPDTTFT